jgi:hypothetical protein
MPASTYLLDRCTQLVPMVDMLTAVPLSVELPPARQPPQKRTAPQSTEFEWALYDVTKFSVLQVTGAYKDSSVAERTRINFTYSIQTGSMWVRQPLQE